MMIKKNIESDPWLIIAYLKTY